MLVRKKILEGIREGSITLAFRRWRRPSVRPGGTLLTPVGELQIGAIRPVTLDRISARDARRAGYDSRDRLIQELKLRPKGTVYRVELGLLRADPRVALRQTLPRPGSDLGKIVKRLQRLDDRASGEPWTFSTLELLRFHPGLRAVDLCAMMGQDKKHFKLNVRKLKNLGLTESLSTGYRLSPRGQALLERLPIQDEDG